MKYKTSSVSRRVVMVKVKAKPGGGAKTPSPKRSESRGRDPGGATVPLLFNRSDSPRTPRVPPPLSWRKWRAVIILFPLVLIALFGIYKSIVAGNPSEVSRSARSEPPAAATPQLPNMRPMGVSASRPTPADGPRQVMGFVSGTAPGVSAGHGVTIRASRDSQGVDGQAVLDGSRKYVLPADVSGNCDIGEGGIKDLGVCIADAGASVR